jgi:hypothetical protein
MARSTLGLVLNPPAYAAVAYRLIDPHVSNLELWVLALGCIIFALMNLNLLRTLVRDGQFMTLWNDVIAELERVNPIEGNVQVFSAPRYLRLRTARGRLQRRLVIAAGCAMVTWLAMSTVPVAMLFPTEVQGGITWITQWLTSC